MTPQEARKWLKKLDIEKTISFDWKSLSFPRQIECIEDKARLKIYFTTRRGAKSYTDGIELIKDAQETPKCNCLYLGLTRGTAKAIIWKDVLKDINEKKDLGINFHETDLTATTSNGSVIYVAGVDVDENERKKLFGRKYKRIVIDEAALYTIDLKDLVYVTLRPATADMQGSITLSGMSSNVTVGLFYELTKNAPKAGPNGEPSGKWREVGWSCHAWTAHENPHVKWQDELEFIAQNQPLLMETPAFKQAYYNLWMVDENALVYKFSRSRNEIRTQLPVFDSPFHYVLGIDLGHSPDPSAFVVACYNDASPFLFVTHVEKHLHMDVTAVAEKIKQLDKKYNFDVKVIDGSMKMAIAEMNGRHGCNVIPADKQGKEHWINLLNSDLIQSRILFSNESEDLKVEMESLVWETDNGTIKIPRKEHASLANHLCDAFLYVWRYTHAYLHSKPVLPVKIDMTKQDQWEPAHLKKLEEQVKIDQNPYRLDVNINADDDLFDFDKDEML